jgi:hypothetical protein
MGFIAASPEYLEVETENPEDLRKSLFPVATTTFHSSVFVAIR